MVLCVSTAGAETATVAARLESCAGLTNSLPCRLNFTLNFATNDQVVNATVIVPVQFSGKGLEPCLRLMQQNPDGSKAFVADDVIRTNEISAHFFATSFFREHARETNFSFYVAQVPGPCAAVAMVAGRQAVLNLQLAPTLPWKLDDILVAVWKSHHMVNETLLPVSLDGGQAEGRLLFDPEGKVVVRNYALDKTYQEGADFVVDGDRIRLPAGSSIPFMTWKQLYPDSADAPPKTMRSWKGGYVAFTEGSFWNDRQISVTYDHKAAWSGPIPSTAPGQLPRTKQKLHAGLPLKVALLGDSISAGASASNERPPHVPGWGELTMDGLRSQYRSAITLVNPSLDGMVSAWGRRVAPFFVAPEKPDLCIIAFGMNDGGNIPVVQYLANTKAMIESVRKENPEAEYILVASWPPNENWRKLAPMDGYLAALKTLESKHIAVADVWSVASQILKTKRYCDVSGNHVNHPNDFMVRIYAQVTDALLGADESR